MGLCCWLSVEDTIQVSPWARNSNPEDIRMALSPSTGSTLRRVPETEPLAFRSTRMFRPVRRPYSSANRWMSSFFTVMVMAFRSTSMVPWVRSLGDRTW
jgi:hypothetical protein